MIAEKKIQGISLKVGPLGENDRLITILSDQEGIGRYAVPGARKPRSSLAAATPLTYLELQVGGKTGLKRVRQIKVLRSFSKVGEKLETLAAAQAIAELSLMLVAGNDPLPGMLSAVLIHLERLEEIINPNTSSINTLATSVQSCIHLLALGGYGLPVQECCRTGIPLEPPIGNWDWKCSLLPNEGFAIGLLPTAEIKLNPSELALLQRLLKPNLPIKKNGELLGPKDVWLKLLNVVDYWTGNHLPRNIQALQMLREIFIDEHR